jgi:hypothetical protein
VDGTSQGFFSHTSGGWDEKNPNGGLEQGGLGFVTLIHELGHGLGAGTPVRRLAADLPRRGRLVRPRRLRPEPGIYTT